MWENLLEKIDKVDKSRENPVVLKKVFHFFHPQNVGKLCLDKPSKQAKITEKVNPTYRLGNAAGLPLNRVFS